MTTSITAAIAAARETVVVTGNTVSVLDQGRGFWYESNYRDVATARNHAKLDVAADALSRLGADYGDAEYWLRMNASYIGGNVRELVAEGVRELGLNARKLDALFADLKAGRKNMTPDLPKFSRSGPADTASVWSWDATRLIVGEGLDDLRIVTRREWAGLE